MVKSRHQNWIRKIDGKHRIFRQLGKKYEVMEYTRYDYTPMLTDKVSKMIRENLTDELISSKFRKKYPADHNRWKYPYFGLCVPSTFVLLYLMDTNVLEPMRGTDAIGGTHFWLIDILTEEKYDLTLDQFPTYGELEDVYATGKPTGYYGKDRGGRNSEMPTSRFFDLIQKVQPSAKRWTTDDYNEMPDRLDEFF